MTKTPVDVERQQDVSKAGVPSDSLKDRFLFFLEYYFGPLKLYLYSFPMPDGMWDNRKWRLKANGVQVAEPPQIEPIVDRLVHIVQRQPAEG